MINSSAKRVAYGGLLTAAALMFSYAESFIPLDAFTGIPGFKLGLANICVMLAVYYLGTVDGLIIALAKCVLTALLFGTPTSFLFSLGGAVTSFCFLVISKYLIKDKISFIGVSVGCAALHNVGQVTVCALVFGDASVLWYLEWLLPLSIVTGTVTGVAALVLGRLGEKRL